MNFPSPVIPYTSYSMPTTTCGAHLSHFFPPPPTGLPPPSPSLCISLLLTPSATSFVVPSSLPSPAPQRSYRGGRSRARTTSSPAKSRSPAPARGDLGRGGRPLASAPWWSCCRLTLRRTPSLVEAELELRLGGDCDSRLELLLRHAQRAVAELARPCARLCGPSPLAAKLPRADLAAAGGDCWLGPSSPAASSSPSATTANDLGSTSLYQQVHPATGCSSPLPLAALLRPARLLGMAHLPVAHARRVGGWLVGFLS
jgi:hypothetical protein